MNELSHVPFNDGLTKSVRLVGGPEGLDGMYVPDEGQPFLRFADESEDLGAVLKDPQSRKFHNYRISFGEYYEYMGFY